MKQTICPLCRDEIGRWADVRLLGLDYHVMCVSRAISNFLESKRIKSFNSLKIIKK